VAAPGSLAGWGAARHERLPWRPSPRSVRFRVEIGRIPHRDRSAAAV